MSSSEVLFIGGGADGTRREMSESENTAIIEDIPCDNRTGWMDHAAASLDTQYWKCVSRFIHEHSSSIGRKGQYTTCSRYGRQMEDEIMCDGRVVGVASVQLEDIPNPRRNGPFIRRTIKCFMEAK